MRPNVVTALLAVALAAPAAGRADGAAGPPVEGLRLTVAPRTAEQLMAFYSARGFPPAAVDYIGRSCFITVGLRNERNEVVWLELAQWRFHDAQGRAVQRLTRADWNTAWDRLRLPPANRATFGWTLLPEGRDLQPGEPVGGNVTLTPAAGPLTLEAWFATGQDRRGRVLRLRVPGLSCPSGGERS